MRRRAVVTTDVLAPTVFRMWEHTQFGDAMIWWSIPDGNGAGWVAGHLKTQPRPGNQIWARMSSGRVGVFIVALHGHDEEYPRDQFKVPVTFSHYLEVAP